MLAVISCERLNLPEQTGSLLLHEPADEQISNLEPLREKLSLHAK